MHTQAFVTSHQTVRRAAVMRRASPPHPIKRSLQGRGAGRMVEGLASASRVSPQLPGCRRRAPYPRRRESSRRRTSLPSFENEFPIALLNPAPQPLPPPRQLV